MIRPLVLYNDGPAMAVFFTIVFLTFDIWAAANYMKLMKNNYTDYNFVADQFRSALVMAGLILGFGIWYFLYLSGKTNPDIFTITLLSWLLIPAVLFWGLGKVAERKLRT